MVPNVIWHVACAFVATNHIKSCAKVNDVRVCGRCSHGRRTSGVVEGERSCEGERSRISRWVVAWRRRWGVARRRQSCATTTVTRCAVETRDDVDFQVERIRIRRGSGDMCRSIWGVVSHWPTCTRYRRQRGRRQGSWALTVEGAWLRA